MLFMSKQSSAPSSDFLSAALDALQTILAQPLEVDPLFPIDGHQAEGFEAHDYLLSSQVLES